jgi:hypothetical protein
VVRGNHESCSRAGRAYFLFLDPTPAGEATRACTGAVPVYTVAVGGKSFVVTDTADVEDECTTNCNITRYADDFAGMKPAPGTWLVTHKPVWAFGKGFTSTTALQQALQKWEGKLPDGITLALAGHLHAWEALSFADGRTPQLVVGNGGTALDPAVDAPVAGRPIGGTTVRYGRIERRFGFTLMQPAPDGAWTATFIDASGKSAFRCDVTPADIGCH